MTSPNLTYTAEGMAAAQARMQATVEAFNGELTKVNNAMAGLRGSWTGGASNTFGAGMDEWEALCKRVIDELLGMHEKLGGNSQALRAQEDDASSIAGSWSQFDQGLQGL